MVDREKIRAIVYQKACANADDFLDKIIDTTIDITLEEHNCQIGRHKKPIDTEKIITLRNSTTPPMSYARIAERMGCSTGTILNRLKTAGVYTPMFKKLPRDGLEAQP